VLSVRNESFTNVSDFRQSFQIRTQEFEFRNFDSVRIQNTKTKNDRLEYGYSPAKLEEIFGTDLKKHC
jgi:DNA replicative helicase MCM subunit Mcm2 (Cdc46/Mcm family)